MSADVDSSRRRGRFSIRLSTLLLAIAGCAVVCWLGVQAYLVISPVRRSASRLRSARSAFARLEAVATVADPNALPSWERDEAYRILLIAMSDPDAYVRSSAAMALSRRHDHLPEVAPLLIALIKDKDSRVRVTALFAVEQLPTHLLPDADAVIRAVVGALDDPKPEVRLEAGRALYVFRQGQRSVPAMAKLVREERGALRMGALGWLILAKNVPKDLEPIVREMLKTDNVSERIWVRRALFMLGITDRERTALIHAMLEGPEPAERLEAAELLIKLGNPNGAIPVLRELANSGTKAISARAERLLFQLDRDQIDAP
jgi:HEAT repeat protein